MGQLQSLRPVHLEAGQVQEAVPLQRAVRMPGIVFPAAGVHVSGIFQEAVLQLLLPRGFQPTQDPVRCRNGSAVLLLQILGHQRFQEDQAAVAVGDGMEKLHRDPVFVGDHPERAAAHLPAAHAGHGVAALLPNRRGMLQLLQVVPEQSPPQPDAHGGEPADGHIQRGLKHPGIHPVVQGGRQPEYIAPALPLGGGINFRGIIQPHPPQLPFRRQVPAEEAVQDHHVLLILRKSVQHIGVPTFRTHMDPADIPGLPQLAAHILRIAQQDLIPAGENQGWGHPGQIPEKRRYQRIFRIIRIAPGIKRKLFL